MINKVKQLIFFRTALISLFAIFSIIILNRISNIEANQTKKIEYANELLKIYKKQENPQYLSEIEINENKKIIELILKQYDEIKEDKIGENGYWWIFAIVLFIVWNLNNYILKRKEKIEIKNVA